jgi:ABC-type nitrate/sulfonate/bicarbonate transport system substrate-binding protein
MSTQSTRARFLQTASAAGALGALPLRTAAQSLTTVNVGATSSDDMAPILYGQKAGIFRKYGLDVQANKMTAGVAAAQALVAGTFDLGKASVTTILSGHEKGIPFSIVSEAFLNNAQDPSSAFIVLKDSPIQTGKDFNGQLVASAGLGDIGTMALSAWVDQHGGDAKTIKFVEIPFPAVGAAIEAGRVAAGVASNPNLAVTLAAGKVRVIPNRSRRCIAKSRGCACATTRRRIPPSSERSRVRTTSASPTPIPITTKRSRWWRISPACCPP